MEIFWEEKSKEELENKYKRLKRELFSMKKNEKISYDFKIEDMKLEELKNLAKELYQSINRKYSKKQHKEYKKICRILKENNDIDEYEIEKQLESKTQNYLRMFINTLEHERHLTFDFEESYLYLKVNLISNLISCLKKEAVKNQDLVDFVIDDIKREIGAK